MAHAISMKIVNGRRLLHVSHVGFRPGTSRVTHVTRDPATTMDARPQGDQNSINITTAGGPATMPTKQEQTNVSNTVRKPNTAGLGVNILMAHAARMKIVNGRRLVNVSHLLVYRMKDV